LECGLGVVTCATISNLKAIEKKLLLQGDCRFARSKPIDEKLKDEMSDGLAGSPHFSP